MDFADAAIAKQANRIRRCVWFQAALASMMLLATRAEHWILPDVLLPFRDALIALAALYLLVLATPFVVSVLVIRTSLPTTQKLYAIVATIALGLCGMWCVLPVFTRY